MTLAMLAQVACTGSTAKEDQEDQDDQDNHFAPDALGQNALGQNALGQNALTSASLNSNILVKNALKDPNAREVFSYIVSCALPAGDHIDVTVQGTTYGYDGALGVAPEWGEPGGECDEECRSWVSGCVIARLDYLQQPKTISLRGKNDGLKSSSQERAAYPHIEATYYGDIFENPQEIYACLPPGKTSLPRVCGPSLAGCIVKVQGQCEDLCGHQRSDGSYPDCREAPVPQKHGCDKKGEKHLGSVTVFLQ
jgi:hypothetical protein